MSSNKQKKTYSMSKQIYFMNMNTMQAAGLNIMFVVQKNHGSIKLSSQEIHANI